MDKSGHRDINNKWVDESIPAKLRNQLSPLWTLVDILSEERLDKLLRSEYGLKMISDLVIRCKENQPKIIELIKQIENPS